MVDEAKNESLPVVETPPASVTPEPPIPPEPVDEAGVPYKNRLAEMNRKLEEERQRNIQYQIALGQQHAPAQPPPTQRRRPQEMFDEETLTGINLLVEQKANEIMQKAQISQQLNDPELNNIAQQEYAILASNSIYADWPDIAKQNLAVTRAENKLLRTRQQATAQQTSQQALAAAAQAQASGASLPGTGGGGPQPADDKARFIKKFMEDPYQKQNFQSMYRGIDINSKEAQERMQRVAETAWKSRNNFFHKEGEPEGRVHYEERG